MSERGAATLMTAVRPLVVLRYLGQPLLVLAVLAAVPMALLLAARPMPGLGLISELGLGSDAAHGQLAILVLALAALSLPLSRLPGPRQIQWNEALAVTALTYLVASLAMAYPLTGFGLSPVDAWFEAVSAVTTTGLSLSTVVDHPALLLFSRAWMQWFGGLGIAVLSLELAMRHHPGGRRLLASPGKSAWRPPLPITPAASLSSMVFIRRLSRSSRAEAPATVENRGGWTTGGASQKSDRLAVGHCRGLSARGLGGCASRCVRGWTSCVGWEMADPRPWTARDRDPDS